MADPLPIFIRCRNSRKISDSSSFMRVPGLACWICRQKYRRSFILYEVDHPSIKNSIELFKLSIPKFSTNSKPSPTFFVNLQRIKSSHFIGFWKTTVSYFHFLRTIIEPETKKKQLFSFHADIPAFTPNTWNTRRLFDSRAHYFFASTHARPQFP